MQIKKIKMTSLMILLMLGMSTSPLASTSAASSARSNPCSGTICLNEVMPNPSGYDDAAWPGGEWAEIKNTGPSAVNVLNWMLQNSNGKTLTFDANSIVGYSAGNSSTWTIQPNDWMVIARNANTNFWMTNTADDLELYDANGTFIGSASWTTAGSGTSYVEDPTNSYADWIAANSSTPGASNSGGATPPSYVQSDLQFSEIFANPVFSNDNSSWPGGEWFEIYNNGSTALNLTGWSAQDAAGNNIVFDEDHVVGWNNADSNSWMIEPDGYRVIAINSTGDYGVLNNNQETLTLQLPNGSLAETISWSSALSGTSKVASSSGTWITSLFPTPEQVNVGWIPDSVNGTSDVFFNEVRANSSVDYSSYPDSDWIELHNNGSSPIDLSGWKFVNSVGVWADIDANTLVANASQAGTYIMAGEYRLIQVEVLGSPHYLHAPYDSVSLVNGNDEIVDAMHWVSDYGLDATMIRGSTIADPWQASSYPTPEQPNPGSVVNEDAEVFISEVLSDAVGNDTSTWPSGEWIELVNTGNTSVDLYGWTLVAGGNKQMEITAERIIGQSNTSIAAGDYVVVAINGSSSFYLRNSNGDSLALQDDTNNVVHSIIWNTDSVEGESFVAVPGNPEMNWVQAIWPTPGEANPFFGPYTGVTTVEITEILPHCYDDSQTPADDWIELHNYGTTDVNLSRWVLAASEGADVMVRHDNIWNRSSSSPTVTILEPDDYIVILAPNYFVKGYGDTLALSDPDGNPIHAVSWTITTDCASLGADINTSSDLSKTLWPTPAEINPNPDDFNLDANVQFTRLMPYQTDYNNRNNEFFELTNFATSPVDLSGWKMTRVSSGGTTYNATFTNLVLSAGESVAISPDAQHLGSDSGFNATAALDVMSAALYLSDDGGSLQLYNPADDIADAVAWKDALLPIEGWNGPAITNPNVSSTGLIYLRGDGCGDSTDSNSSADWEIKWSRLGASHQCLGNTFSTTGTLTPTISPTGALGELLEFINSANVSLNVHVYQLYSAELVHALKSAAQRGVMVTVVLNQPEYNYWSGYETDRQYGMASELDGVGANVMFVGESTDNDAPSSPYLYIHSKIAVKDGDSVWIGSGNWKSSSHPTSEYSGNREWGVIIDNSEIASMFLQRLSWDEDPDHLHVIPYTSSMKPSSWVMPTPVTDPQPYGVYTPISGAFSGRILTCPDDCMEGLVAGIEAADDSIYLSLASFDMDWYWGWGENPVLAALEAKAAAGVKIHMIIDDTYSNEETNEAIDMFNHQWNHSNGWDTAAVIMSTDSEISSLHNKGMIVDDEIVLISSINWNANSILRNREMGIMIENPDLAAVYKSSWQEDWNRLDESTDSDGDTLPDSWEVAKGLNRTNALISGMTIGEEGIDSDGDGLINSLEYIYGSEPLDNDSDGDCIDDGKEAAWAMSLENLSNDAKISFAKLAVLSTDADANGVNDGIQFECGINFTGSTSTNPEDSDGDGVVDSEDQCIGTPAGTTVNIQGCPLTVIVDSDSDGIPDSVDECPNTLTGNNVSSKGCSDQQLSDNLSSGDDDEEENKSSFFMYIIIIAGIFLIGSLIGIVRSRNEYGRFEEGDDSGKDLTDVQTDWSAATLDASAAPVLDGSTQAATTAPATNLASDVDMFPGWTQEVIQTYLDQGWSLEQLKDWYDQHS